MLFHNLYGILATPLGSFLFGRMFGRKAVETGAFRTAWAPAASFTEHQKAGSTCCEPNVLH